MALHTLIILQYRRELIIRRDKVCCFTRGNKVGLRKIPETVEISRNIDPSKAQGSSGFRSNYKVVVKLVKFTNRHFSHCDWPASLSRPAK